VIGSLILAAIVKRVAAGIETNWRDDSREKAAEAAGTGAASAEAWAGAWCRIADIVVQEMERCEP
jgi:hypothetical protein